jgi:hypothetical protein
LFIAASATLANAQKIGGSTTEKEPQCQVSAALFVLAVEYVGRQQPPRSTFFKAFGQ